LSAGITATDLGAPSIFSFGFSTPIVPLDAPVLATLSLTAVLTDFTGDGVAMSLVSSALAEGRLEGLFVLDAGAGFSVSDAALLAGGALLLAAAARLDGRRAA
jgi:hypothetical protein